jgi:hypothetical protein
VCCRRVVRPILERELAAPRIAGPSYLTAVAVTRAGHLGSDPFYDLVGFVLGDLNVLI